MNYEQNEATTNAILMIEQHLKTISFVMSQLLQLASNANNEEEK